MLGKITEIESNSIVLEVSGIGYQIYTPNPYSFDFNTEYKVYLYQYIREDENSLYGFKTKEEKEMFLKLIGVKGLGPKMALPILATGSIPGIVDAIEKAGGVTEVADLSMVNLAYKLSDGQKLYIPSVNDKVEEYVVVTSGNGNINNNDVKVDGNEKVKVNINTASQTELETLTGIGPSIAERIIQYRKENGGFKKIEELKKKL